jgi:hypothetical protein
MRREPYHCPHCHQSCSRHWNLKVHIQRKHWGIGQQPIGSVSLSTRAEFIPSMSNLGANGRYRHHQEALPYYVHHSSSKESEESSPLPSPTSNEKDASQNYSKPYVRQLNLRRCQNNFNPFLLLLVPF